MDYVSAENYDIFTYSGHYILVNMIFLLFIYTPLKA